ncbi:MAG: PilN domain-containing protein [Nitrospirota bacterium]
MKEYVNLLPLEYLPRKIPLWQKMGLMFLILCLSFAVVVTGSKFGRVKEFQRDIKRITQQKLSISSEVERLKKEIANKEQRQKEEAEAMKMLKGLLQDKVLWSEMMREISFVIPEGVWLTKIDTTPVGTDRLVRFSGRATKSHLVMRFFSMMEERSHYIKNVKLISLRKTEAEKDGEEEVVFEMEGTLKAIVVMDRTTETMKELQPYIKK